MRERMAPRDANSGDAASESLESRIASIAAKARERNPTGFKLAPIEALHREQEARDRSLSPERRGGSHESAPPTFFNPYSGQQVLLCSGVKNVPSHLLAC